MNALQGAERTYQFDLSNTNRKCKLEEATGMPFEDVLAAIRRRRTPVTVLRQFIRCGLVDPPDVSLEEAGQIMDDIGGAPVIQQAVRGLKRSRRG